MSVLVEHLKEFVHYWESLSGDEKGEAQVFCDRLFRAFGHAGYKEAGAALEWRVKGNGARKGTTYADLVWKPRLLLEMKRRGEKLDLHFRQAFDYWINLVPNRPRYVVLCNFDQFWIYDFDKQIDRPVDVVLTRELPKRYLPLSFMLPENPEPIFGNDTEAVTKEAAELVARVFCSLVERGEDRNRAQRFVLQTVVAMFAEDGDLMPRGMVSRIVADCFKSEKSYDLFAGLFRQMNSPEPARGGRYKDVPYFNGGLFAMVEPIELSVSELHAVGTAAEQDWSQVNPAIFGTLFQHSMDAKRRHELGAHFTMERDIMKVVGPTVAQPWDQRIRAAKTAADLLSLRKELLTFRVLDPACGSGNFLYLAYRELVRLEILILARLAARLSTREYKRRVQSLSLVSPRQFFGIDIDPFAVELAKITLLFGKKLALDEVMQTLEARQLDLDLHQDQPLPLENLDGNIVQGDALFNAWPRADVIVGNPPYQSKNKMQEEFGRAYLNKLRAKYPAMPGRADYCVFWFRRAHDELAPGNRAGLVGTNTIRQNYSREGGLDHIVANGGTITNAVSSQVWSGDAVVHVSIVNWIKGEAKGKKRISRQLGDSIDSPWEAKEVDVISAALTFETDVTTAGPLRTNAQSGACYQGQTHGHSGFLLSRAEGDRLIAKDERNGAVLFPYLIGDELLGQRDSLPQRYVIDFGNRDLHEGQEFRDCFRILEEKVLPSRKERAQREDDRNREARKDDQKAHVLRDHAAALSRWWLLFRRRGEMLHAISRLTRYVACVRVTKRPVFEFIDPAIHPNDALQVFPLEDDYSFGVLQSDVHWKWFIARCSTLKADFRYTSNSVFDPFPWPQKPTAQQVRLVAAAAVDLRELRWQLRRKHGLSLRELYRAIEKPGKHALVAAHDRLNAAVRAAYGMRASNDMLSFLLDLNLVCAAAEAKGHQIEAPGIPTSFRYPAELVSEDRIALPGIRVVA
jgi:SAM-dependent methyltransferase